MHYLLGLISTLVKNTGHARELALRILPLLSKEHLREILGIVLTLLSGNPAAAAQVRLAEQAIETALDEVNAVENLRGPQPDASKTGG